MRIDLVDRAASNSDATDRANPHRGPVGFGKTGSSKCPCGSIPAGSQARRRERFFSLMSAGRKKTGKCRSTGHRVLRPCRKTSGISISAAIGRSTNVSSRARAGSIFRRKTATPDEATRIGRIRDALPFTVRRMEEIDTAYAQAFPDRG